MARKVVYTTHVQSPQSERGLRVGLCGQPEDWHFVYSRAAMNRPGGMSLITCEECILLWFASLANEESSEETTPNSQVRGASG